MQRLTGWDCSAQEMSPRRRVNRALTGSAGRLGQCLLTGIATMGARGTRRGRQPLSSQARRTVTGCCESVRDEASLQPSSRFANRSPDDPAYRAFVAHAFVARKFVARVARAATRHGGQSGVLAVKAWKTNVPMTWTFTAPPAGFEPATNCLEGSRSVH